MSHKQWVLSKWDITVWECDGQYREEELKIISNTDITLVPCSVQILQTKPSCCRIWCAKHFCFLVGPFGSLCVSQGEFPPPLREATWSRVEKHWRKTPPQITPTDFRKTEIALTNVTHVKINPKEQLQHWLGMPPLLKGCFVSAGVCEQHVTACGVATSVLSSDSVGQVSDLSHP